jgi:formylglycine-generating enzyme required for sulfatase activity
VSWDDAQAFCNWLTKKDHEEGLLGPNQSYRLPKDDEWTRAVGPGKYPWGDSSSPPLEAGNYCRQGDSSSFDYTSFRGTDGYAYTSPVGKFKPNSYGLYDMGGNVYQWCDDWYTASLNNDEVKTQDKELANDAGGHMYKVLRGSSWGKGGPEYLLSATRCFDIPTTYNLSGDVGFRIVVVISR